MVAIKVHKNQYNSGIILFGVVGHKSAKLGHIHKKRET